MIVDLLKNAGIYRGIHPDFERAIAFAASLSGKPAGRYDFGEHYVLVKQGETEDTGGADLEAHRKYADVQVIFEGEECVRYAPLPSLTPTADYDERDDELYARGPSSPIRVSAGMFYAVFPDDAHAPAGCFEAPSSFRKAVLKLKL